MATKKRPTKKTRVGSAKTIVRAATTATTAAGRRAEVLLATVARLKDRIAEDFYELGEALRDLLRHKLYVALGYASFDAMLAARKVISARTARKLIGVVEAMTIEQAMELGSEKAYGVARLVKATPEDDTVDSVLDKGVKVAGKRRLPASMSAREIAATTRKVRNIHTRDPEATEARRLAAALRAAFRDKGARKTKVEAAKVGGAWCVRVEVPAAEAALVFRGAPNKLVRV